MDELEVLASIYGDDWKVVDVTQRVYSIDITCEELKLSLQVVDYCLGGWKLVTFLKL